jgi:hypothetical protein
MSKILFVKRERDKLFYDQYQYAIDFHLEGATTLRSLDIAAIDARIRHRTMYDNAFYRPLSFTEINTIYRLRDSFLNATGNFKKVLAYNYVYLYTNDYSLIEQFCNADYLVDRFKTVAEAVVSYERDVVMLKNPRHRLRTYLKWHMMTDPEVKSLHEFLYANADEYRPSPTLQRMLSSKNAQHYRSWTREWDFIDHNTEQQLLMINLICNQLIRKTVKIKAK